MWWLFRLTVFALALSACVPQPGSVEGEAQPTEAKCDTMPCKILRIEGLPGPFVGGVEAPVAIINDHISAIWIDPDSEADSVVVQAGNIQNNLFLTSGNYVSGFFGNGTAAQNNAQPWQTLKSGIVVSKGAPLILDMQPQVLLYAYPDGAFSGARVAVGYSVGGVPNSIPQFRGVMKYYTFGSPAGLAPLRLVFPTYGRKFITLAVTNSDGANAATANLVLHIAQSNTTDFVSAATGAQAVAANTTKIFAYKDFFANEPQVDFMDLQISGPSTSCGIMVRVAD